ncbi:MAG: YdeI/OmpD-associated family protein [Bacteroidia bacterium]|nr:YdeI/OmpD-associated family protein [Bacteroidia bacterium]
MSSNDLEHVLIHSRAEWRAWLAGRHTQRESIWLVYYKKASGKGTLTYDDIVEEALCFGWIDSKTNKVDDARSKLLLSPRKPGSNWSKRNKDLVARLAPLGLIAPAGWAKIEAAKQDGTWTALDEVEAGTIPPDLYAALEALPPALANFEGFPKSVRRGILEQLLSAKTEATRQKRIALVAEMAARGERAFQYVPPERR